MANRVTLSAAECALDLGDGSERGFYVNQDYILQKMHAVHRGISLMYTYYPNDKTWPIRSSIACPQETPSGAWDYPYEDYFPYRGGREGKLNDEPFNFMKEIRRHGQDVVLTLTIDPTLTEEDIVLIAKDLRPYGRVLLRVNHECTGTWFCFTKRASFQQLADFYVMVCKVMHEHAPNVKMILCAGMWQKETGKIEMEDEFLEAFKVTDYWSCDQYLSLHWGWPVDVATKETSSYSAENVDEVYDNAKKTLHRLREVTGMNKPFVMSELNADGDVSGPYEQALMMQHFMTRLQQDEEKWLSAFTMYQFRDDGRLGLEVTDPNNKDVGIEQPLLATYREQLHKSFFRAKIISQQAISLPCQLTWTSSEDAEGIELSLDITQNPHYAEVYFPGQLKDLNLMIELDGWWFYKAPGTKCVDLMSYFFEHKIQNALTLPLRFFAPPAEGTNPQNVDGTYSERCVTELSALPEVRLEFEPVKVIK